MASGFVSIFVRRDEGPEPGAAIFAVLPDGGEMLLRTVPDSILAGPGKVGDFGSVSESGWLATGVDAYGGPWPMILVDLGDASAKPWVISEASLGGPGPRWGPTGLVAAPAAAPADSGGLVIADPKSHTTRMISMQGHGLVGGGPSIVWTADGAGIVATTEGEGYDTVPIDGSAPRPGVGQVYDPHGLFGSGLAQLRVCSPGTGCPGGDDGRIDRVAGDGSVETIWRQQGADRALAAGFGGSANEYWLSVDHDSGRQIALVHVHDGLRDTVATVNRAADWDFISAPLEAPDHSALVTWVRLGDKPAHVLVPLTGAPPTLHNGLFFGFVNSAASTLSAIAPASAPVETMPAVGRRYALPSIDALISAELGLNPGHRVLGKASHEAVDGDTAIRTVEVNRDDPGGGVLYLDCIGPSSVTVTSGAESVTSPCLGAGGASFEPDVSEPIVVTASGDTSWRVVIYSP